MQLTMSSLQLRDMASNTATKINEPVVLKVENLIPIFN